MYSEAAQKLHRAVGGDQLILQNEVEELHKQVLDAHEAFRCPAKRAVLSHGR
jgi:hypothetical protein